MNFIILNIGNKIFRSYVAKKKLPIVITGISLEAEKTLSIFPTKISLLSSCKAVADKRRGVIES